MLERNRPLTDADLDMILPKEGFEIVPPPADYQPQKKSTEQSKFTDAATQKQEDFQM